MKIDTTTKDGLFLLGVAVVAIMLSFFLLKFKYEHTIEKHCEYIAREVSDLGPPEKVCPRVCERHKTEYDVAFSYSERKLGTECNCCSKEFFLGNENSTPITIPEAPQGDRESEPANEK